MLTQHRKQVLLERLRKDGRLVAKKLSEEFGLSEDTLRRDLRELAAEGLLQRVHGGALPASPTVAPLAVRRDLAAGEKNKLSVEAAKLVEAGQCVFIDGGTTHLHLLRHIPLDLAVTIVTHSPPVAAALELHRANVVMIGGVLFKHSMVNIGAAACDAIQRMRFDLAFVGFTGFHAEEGGTTGDYEEAELKRAAISRAAESVAILTQDKIGAVSMHTVCKVSDLATIFVSEGSNTHDIERRGVNVLRVV
jgi:DeoR/GlpR family transcriptional regulator of sugar metabolism